MQIVYIYEYIILFISLWCVNIIPKKYILIINGHYTQLFYISGNTDSRGPTFIPTYFILYILLSLTLSHCKYTVQTRVGIAHVVLRTTERDIVGILLSYFSVFMSLSLQVLYICYGCS